MSLFTKLTHRLRERTLLGGREGTGIVREFEICMYTLLYLKRTTNKDLLYSTGNPAQCSVVTYMRRKSKKTGYMCTYS